MGQHLEAMSWTRREWRVQIYVEARDVDQFSLERLSPSDLLD